MNYRPRPSSNPWYYYKMRLFDFTLDYIKQYIQESAKIVEKNMEEIEKKIKEYDEANPLVNREVQWDEDGVRLEDYTGFDYMEDDIMKYSEFTKILNSSMLVSLYSFFEQSMKDICNSEGVTRRETQMPEGSGYIEDSWKYITKTLKVDINDLNKEWEKINGYRKIRKLIVHHGSNYWRDKNKPIDKQDFHELITTFNGIQTDNHGNFYIYDTAVLLDFCNLIEEFLDKLMDKL